MQRLALGAHGVIQNVSFPNLSQKNHSKSYWEKFCPNANILFQYHSLQNTFLGRRNGVFAVRKLLSLQLLIVSLHPFSNGPNVHRVYCNYGGVSNLFYGPFVEWGGEKVFINSE